MALDVGAERDGTFAAALRPYVANLHAAWLRDHPDTRYRCITGTLVFADVSGFTPLTERLAGRGRVGAEALTDILNQVFDTLLTVAGSYGGDLLKFGGDALLLLFHGADHERHAVAAAAAMQKALRPWRTFRTEAGTMSLRMSVGVATGEIHGFLVGCSHRELLVGGPVVSRVVAHESAADAGEILLDDATAAVLDPAELGEAKAPGRLLRRAPAAGPVLPRQYVADDVSDGVPVGLRGHLSERVDDGEHRQAVLTFVQFKGLDRLLSTEGPSAATEALHDLVQRVQQACEEHGVFFLATDLDGDGGKILLVAGAPTASTDDVDRTLVALLDVVGHASPLAVRAGVNAGPAFAVDVGSATRRTYAVMGDATNLAARVMGKATPGQVVATRAALARTHTSFDHDPLEPFKVKGKTHPVMASVVRRPGQRLVAVPGGGLVGRERERRELDALLAGARGGASGLVRIVGEAGIGKSVLVAFARDRADGMASMRFETAPYAASSPYFAVRRPLRALLGLNRAAGPDDAADLTRALGAVSPELAVWAPMVGVVLGIDVDDNDETRVIAPEFRRSRAHAAVRQVVTTLLPGPALFVVEDEHWLDDASAALLSEIAGDADGRGWAMVVTSRPAGPQIQCPVSTTTLRLEPLDPDEVTLLAATALGEVPAHVRQRLIERSGGNPLFLLELLEAARQGKDTESLPETLEALVASRVDTLGPRDRTLVRHASVLGNRFPPALLAALTGSDEGETARRLSALDRFVVPDGRAFRFVHALVRDAAYGALPYRQRRVLHGRAGALLEAHVGDAADEWADLLSLHFEQAQEHAKAWHYGRVAGERARGHWAPADACIFYRRALDAARHLCLDDAEVARVHEALGDAAEVAGRYADAAAAYREARRLAASDPVHAADLCRKEGWVRERGGKYSAALRWYGRGMRSLEGHHDAALTRAQLALAAGAARLRQGRYRDALPLLQDAVRTAEERDDRRTLAHAYYLLDWAYTDLGRDEALRYRELSLPIYEELGDLTRQSYAYNNLGIDAYFEGRWTEAVDLYERGRSASARAGDIVQTATVTNNIGEIYSDQGRLDEAGVMFRDALVTWRSASFLVGISLATSNLGRAAARDGDFGQAAELIAQARQGFVEIRAEGYVLETDARDVERLVLSGEGELARDAATGTLRRVEQLGGLPGLGAMLRRLEGYACAQLGDAAGARTILRDALARAEASGYIYERALTLDALGRVLGTSEGEDCRVAAAALLDRLGVVAVPSVPLPEPQPDLAPAP